VISLKEKKYANISEIWLMTDATPNKVGVPPTSYYFKQYNLKRIQPGNNNWSIPEGARKGK
jgi:hypothetical protein